METLRNQIDLSFLSSSDKEWITDTADNVLKTKHVFVRCCIVIWLYDI